MNIQNLVQIKFHEPKIYVAYPLSFFLYSIMIKKIFDDDVCRHAMDLQFVLVGSQKKSAALFQILVTFFSCQSFL